MAPSSSAKKVAKLATRGKGKKVRFQSGTTFPTVLASVIVAMLALVVYAKVSLPSVESGEPQPGTTWVSSYAFQVCDTQFALTGTADEVTSKDASTGDANTSRFNDGIIHYHPREGGASGGKAKLGVFLDVYGVKLNNSKLVLPDNQVDPDATRVWDIDDSKVFDGTPCEGKEAALKVRVWNDYSSGEFYDAVTDFKNLRIKNNGMVFVVAIVPAENDYAIDRPASACDLEDFGAIGTGNLCKPGTDTTAVTDTTGVTDTTDAATTTTGG